jgi:hypothetical protein
MTIHRRRGSGTWYYWAFAVFVLVVAVVGMALGYDSM